MPATTTPLRIRARQLRCPAPAEAILLPCTAFPIPVQERDALLRVFVSLSRTLLLRSKAQSHSFLHVSSGKNPEAAPLFAPHAKRWMPELGFGVWLGRKPPSLWTREDLEKAEPGERLRPLVELVFRITTDEAAKEHARSTMFGTGSVIEVQTRDDGPTYARRGTQLLLPTIQDASFKSYPYYFPLIDAGALASVSFAQLQAWLCGAGIWMAESVDDSGVLVLSLDSLRPALDQLGATADPDNAGCWLIPVS